MVTEIKSVSLRLRCSGCDAENLKVGCTSSIWLDVQLELDPDRQRKEGIGQSEASPIGRTVLEVVQVGPPRKKTSGYRITNKCSFFSSGPPSISMEIEFPAPYSQHLKAARRLFKEVQKVEPEEDRLVEKHARCLAAWFADSVVCHREGTYEITAICCGIRSNTVVLTVAETDEEKASSILG